MGQTAAAQPTFAEWLRAELEERGWGVRTLARHVNPEQPEIARRAINRYVHDGATPSEPYAIAIAEALGVARSSLPLEEVAPAGDTFRDGASSDAGPGDREGRGSSDRGGAGATVKDAA